MALDPSPLETEPQREGLSAGQMRNCMIVAATQTRKEKA